MKWIKFKTRKLTEEEIESYPTWDFIWDCLIPDVGDAVLVSNGKMIWIDTWTEVGYGTDLLEDEAEGLYWMPLPELPKEAANE